MIDWKVREREGAVDGPKTYLHSRPPILPSNLVPTKLLLPISIPNIRVDIVIVKHPALDRIVVNTLPTRTVDIAVRLKHDGTATLRARLPCGVDLRERLA